MKVAAIIGGCVAVAVAGGLALAFPDKVAIHGWMPALRVGAYFGLLSFTLVSAFRAGGGPERLAVAIIVVQAVADLAGHSLLRRQVAHADPLHLFLDSVVLVAFVAIALRANRFWTLCLSAMQFIMVLAHLARALDAQLLPAAYQIMQTAWSYVQLALIAGGTWTHQRRLTSRGADPSWRSSSRPSTRPPN